jgi:HK97 family phage portal protein
MSLASRLKAAWSALLLGSAYSRNRPLVITVPVVPFSARPGSGAILKAYEEDGWLRAVVDTVTDQVGAARWRVYRAVGDEGKRAVGHCKGLGPSERQDAIAKAVRRGRLVEVQEHELLLILNDPHPEHTGQALQKLVQINLDLAGEAFLWLRQGITGRIRGFDVLPTHAVTMTPTPGRPYYRVTYNLFSGDVHQNEMMWLKHLAPFNPEGRGAGRGMALGDELDTAEALQKATKATFQRGSAAAVVGVDSKREDGEELEEQVAALEKKYQDSFRRPEDTGKLWFTPGNVTVARMEADLRALQTQELKQTMRDLVRQCFNVPPELLGDLQSSNRSTAEAAKYTLAEYATLPRLEWLRAQYQKKLAARVDPSALLDFDDPRPQSWERTHQAMTAAYNEAFLMNEAREHAGLAPLPELAGQRFKPLPGAQPVQDGTPTEPQNPPPPRGPEKTAR